MSRRRRRRRRWRRRRRQGLLISNCNATHARRVLRPGRGSEHHDTKVTRHPPSYRRPAFRTEQDGRTHPSEQARTCTRVEHAVCGHGGVHSPLPLLCHLSTGVGAGAGPGLPASGPGFPAGGPGLLGGAGLMFSFPGAGLVGAAGCSATQCRLKEVKARRRARRWCSARTSARSAWVGAVGTLTF